MKTAYLCVAAFLLDRSVAEAPPQAVAVSGEADVAAAPIKPVSLLHQRAATASSVSAHSNAAAAGPLWEKGRPVNPKPRGHMLTDHELKPVNSVSCLEAKQLDPRHNCTEPLPPGVGSPSNHLNAGNYPSWWEARCHGYDNEFFCDPDELLSYDQRKKLAATMKSLREGQKITCGPQLQHDPVDKWHYEPFYLGVAIAKDWPLHESDAQSLQSFGRILAGRWNMTYPWNGNPAYYARCPNEGMLIILPEQRQAHLSTSSCMFICEDKGGPEVATATLLGLDNHDLFAGVKAGMAEVYKVLGKSSPMHAPGWEPVEKTVATWRPWSFWSEESTERNPRVDGLYAYSSWPQFMWNYGQRILFIFAALLLAGSVAVAILVCYLAPGLAKDLNKPVV